MCSLWLGKSLCHWFPEAEEMISHCSPPDISCWSQRSSSFPDCSLFPWEAVLQKPSAVPSLCLGWRRISVGCTAVPKFSAFPNFERQGVLLRVTWTGVLTGRVQLGSTVKSKDIFFHRKDISALCIRALLEEERKAGRGLETVICSLHSSQGIGPC